MKRILLMASLLYAGVSHGTPVTWGTEIANVTDNDIVVYGSKVYFPDGITSIAAVSKNVDVYFKNDNHHNHGCNKYDGHSKCEFIASTAGNTTLAVSAAAGRVVTFHVDKKELALCNPTNNTYSFEFTFTGLGTIIMRVGTDPEH